ncbi:DUF4166 domain-containing protein [Paenibacillus herberti]|uniref:DUF4166 domain-containing protein n=1 Tax=Paenibacillus herberti TaxID=1619309 RepID=A0A229NVY8_9BACL|nr:DUF4166 domain-containing protein [Paenibacillus herberti]OXM13809.1 hypothetical protein CGZ75_20060 [Paenibacillus herberti]
MKPVEVPSPRNSLLRLLNQQSIYEKALGSRFNELHPLIRERFSLHSGSGLAARGEGIMHSIWYSKLAALPLQIGTYRNIMFPESGTEIPFSIENYAYRDTVGRETVTWVRKFRFPHRVRRFDATMIYSRERGCIVDYLGNRQHLAVDIEAEPSSEGGIRIRSGSQRFYEGWLGFRFPDSFTGRADVHEWYDERLERFRIEVRVRSPLIGDVFRYEGSFRNTMLVLGSAAPPADVLPLRIERRE